jgi:hypothetical protein
VHDFAVQGGAITSFVGCCMLNKHFRYSIRDHNSTVTTNAGILILLLTWSMFVSGSGKSHKWYAGWCFVWTSAGFTLWWRGRANLYNVEWPKSIGTCNEIGTQWMGTLMLQD